MIAAEARAIVSAPKTYQDWLDCFHVLEHRDISREEARLLCAGECVGAAGSLEYLERQLVKTINVMIKRYIRIFNKELDMYAMYNEHDDLHRLFVRLSNKFNLCMFFVHLDFLSVEFRNELRDSIISEISRFWNFVLKSIYTQCMEQNNVALEEQLYMIKRIKLFREGAL